MLYTRLLVHPFNPAHRLAAAKGAASRAVRRPQDAISLRKLYTELHEQCHVGS